MNRTIKSARRLGTIPRSEVKRAVKAIRRDLAAPSEVETLRRLVRTEFVLLVEVRNTLHVHNRPDIPLPNAKRIACRGFLEGSIRRLRSAIGEPTRPARSEFVL